MILLRKYGNFCIQRGVHLSAAHIPGIHNITANIASREFKDNHEWMLSPTLFNKLTRISS